MCKKFIPNKLWEDCVKLDYITYITESKCIMNSTDYHKLPMFIPSNVTLDIDYSMLKFIPNNYYKLVGIINNNLITISNKEV